MGIDSKGGKVKKKLLRGLIFLAIVYPLALHAQWAKTYGGTEDDKIYAIMETGDGGFVAVGRMDSMDFWDDAFVMKLSPEGNIEWTRRYGGPEVDWAMSVLPLEDGGIIVVGSYEEFSNDLRSAMVLMLDAKGNLEWQLLYSENDNTNLYSVDQTLDDGFILAGVTYSEFVPEPDIVVTKINSIGEALWEKIYKGTNHNYPSAIQQTADGGYILAAISRSFTSGDRDCLLLRLDSSGEILWQNRYSGGADEQANDVQQTSDGGFILTGWTKAYGAGETDCWILKIKAGGTIDWQRSFGGSCLDAINSIQEMDDGGFIVAGTTTSFGAGSSDGHITKLTASGEVEWQRTFGGIHQDVLNDIQKTSNGGYIAAGYTTSFGEGKEDAFVVNIDSNGNIGSACPLIRTSTPLETLTAAVPEETNLVAQNSTVWEETFELNPSSPSLEVNTLCLAEKHTLVIKTTNGGTTDPAPGNYIYSESSVANIEAIPQNQSWRFDRWSGDIPVGMETINPLLITMDSDKEITAHFERKVLPPLQFAGNKVTNQSLSQREYINVLSWAANPENENITKYRIYLTEGINHALLVELNSQTFHYWHRQVERDMAYTYTLKAVNESGIESEGVTISVQ